MFGHKHVLEWKPTSSSLKVALSLDTPPLSFWLATSQAAQVEEWKTAQTPDGKTYYYNVSRHDVARNYKLRATICNGSLSLSEHKVWYLFACAWSSNLSKIAGTRCKPPKRT
eukprot:1733046-Amphidinium_carterae.1